MGKKRKVTLTAANADKYALYIRSVQAPDYDVKFFRRAFKSAYGRTPEVLREDFCGTAVVCAEWVKKAGATAYGVDLDPEPLEYGRTHFIDALSDEAKARVHLIEGDVRTAKTPKADVLAAQNFSYYLFKTRDELREYFRTCRRHLKDEGVVVLDLFGGAEVQEDEHEDVTEHKDFDYIWEQASFDPITYEAVFHIHFRFRDKSKIKRAFTYDWRLWTIPEVRETLLEAGFAKAEAYWEGTDDDGEGSGVYRRATHGTADPAWNAYVVGVK